MQMHLSPFVGILVFEVEKIIQTQAIVIYLHLGPVHQSAKEYSWVENKKGRSGGT